MSSKEPRSKKPMTDKQKAARLLNLERGRQIRKEKQQAKSQEYDLSSESSESSDSESDNDAFVISRTKKVVPKEVIMKQSRSRKHVEEPRESKLEKEFDELKNAVYDLMKKSTKQPKAKRSGGGTKIVVVPQNVPQSKSRTTNDIVLEALQNSFMR
jgi:hypothetical protein